MREERKGGASMPGSFSEILAPGYSNVNQLTMCSNNGALAFLPHKAPRSAVMPWYVVRVSVCDVGGL